MGEHIHPSISARRCVNAFHSSPPGLFLSASRVGTSGRRPSMTPWKAFSGRAATTAWGALSLWWSPTARSAATGRRRVRLHSGCVLHIMIWRRTMSRMARAAWMRRYSMNSTGRRMWGKARCRRPATSLPQRRNTSPVRASHLHRASRHLSWIPGADVVAFGATWAVAACGGPVLKFRGGRKDAAGPGLPGVPEPNQTLTTHVEKFRLQGFNATEMIQLVACGHTLGGVRNVDFPEVVRANTSDPSGVGLQDFDTTTQFDTAVVTEYLNGTTQNPLVVPASNVSFASDLRIFSSDGNVTMKSLASPTSFTDTCATMLARMLNTVPSDTQLTDEIELLPVKVRDAKITVVNSALLFITSLRLSRPADKPVPQGRTLNLFWCDRRGQFQDCAGGSANVASNFTATGPIDSSPLLVPANIALDSYDIAVPITANQSVGKFWFVLDEHDGSGPQTLDNGGDGYLFPQDEVIAVYELGSAKAIGDGSSRATFTYVTGIRTDINVTNATMFGYTSDTYPNTLNYTVPLQHNKTGVVVDGYAYYFGSIVDSGSSLMLDLEVVGSDNTTYTADYIRGGVAGPGSVFVPPVAPVSVTTLASIPTGVTSTAALTATQSQKASSALISSAAAAMWMMIMGAVVLQCLDNI